MNLVPSRRSLASPDPAAARRRHFVLFVTLASATALGVACGTSSSGDGPNPSLDAGVLVDAAPLSDGTLGGDAPSVGPLDGSIGDASLDAPGTASGDGAIGDAGVEASGPPQPCAVANGVATFTNGNVQIDYDLDAGTATFSSGGVAKVKDFYAGVDLASYTTNQAYTARTCEVQGNHVVVTNTASGLPTMIQSFVLAADSFLATLTVQAPSGATVSTNWISPVVVSTTGGVDVGSYADPRVLWMPFDNDNWVTYNAGSINSSGTSFEAAAFYDNTSRNGIVVGSVTHDTWKSGIYYAGANNKLDAMNVFGGANDATYTHDVIPHGAVSGASISSPTMFVGYADDWRDLLEEYAGANAAAQPRLGWDGGVPFGWNSWGKLQTKISYDAAVTVSDYIAQNLQGSNFSNGGTVYVNLDSYWDNLSASQLGDFVSHCHANGQKAGVYWTPFVDWGESATRVVEGTASTPYSQIWLRDKNDNPIPLDGAYAVDPTNPATKTRVDYFIDTLKGYGFEYIKLDFLSHGALESTVRADPTVQTGIQAYNQGMKYVLDRIAGAMFVSESIAPLFPYQYGHARRVSCDVSGAATTGLGSAEYELNSATYSWWLSGPLYAFNDPDMMVFEGYTADDNMTRLLSAVISGTVFLDGDDLTEATGQALARAYLTDGRLNDVVRLGRAFRPVEGNTGTSAATEFVLVDGTTYYLAVFNFGTSATTTSVDLARAGLDGTHAYAVSDLWSGVASSATGTLSVALEAGSGKIFTLK